MKTNFKIGQRVKTQDGDIAIIIGIYERDKAPNEILIHLEEIDIDIMEYECNLEKCDKTYKKSLEKCERKD